MRKIALKLTDQEILTKLRDMTNKGMKFQTAVRELAAKECPGLTYSLARYRIEQLGYHLVDKTVIEPIRVQEVEK